MLEFDNLGCVSGGDMGRDDVGGGNIFLGVDLLRGRNNVGFWDRKRRIVIRLGGNRSYC